MKKTWSWKSRVRLPLGGMFSFLHNLLYFGAFRFVFSAFPSDAQVLVKSGIIFSYYPHPIHFFKRKINTSWTEEYWVLRPNVGLLWYCAFKSRLKFRAWGTEIMKICAGGVCIYLAWADSLDYRWNDNRIIQGPPPPPPAISPSLSHAFTLTKSSTANICTSLSNTEHNCPLRSP